MAYLIVSNKKWNERICEKLARSENGEFILIDKESELTGEHLKELQARYVFFVHWSHMIPPEIYDNYECVIFHMTDVPFGRGGSPLQNLIARGIYETKISALRCQAKLDAGPVYLKKPFSLYGSAEEIYMRASQVVEEMILYIIKNEPLPTDQNGEIIVFKRRKPEDGNIADLSDIHQIFDYIRMLDAEGYPKAFIVCKGVRYEFSRAALYEGRIIADVKITKLEDGTE